MSLRINARIDQELSRKLAYLERRTHQGQSEIVRQALELYYETIERRTGEAARMLHESGFVGCGEAESDLSERYKEQLAESLKGKA